MIINNNQQKTKFNLFYKNWYKNNKNNNNYKNKMKIMK